MLHGLPRPRPDHDTEPFWAGCREGRFLVPVCDACGRGRWPPGPMCPYCRATATTWTPSDGQGRVYSWVVVTHPVDEVLVDQVPYVVGLIDLPEGVRVVGNVVGGEPGDLSAGEPVELFFEDAEDGMRMPTSAASTTEKGRHDEARGHDRAGHHRHAERLLLAKTGS